MEAEEYARSISKNETYQKYLKEAFIAGENKAKEKEGKFAEWCIKSFVSATRCGDYILKKKMYSFSELMEEYEIFNQTK